jgi:hypothetical protein
MLLRTQSCEASLAHRAGEMCYKKHALLYPRGSSKHSGPSAAQCRGSHHSANQQVEAQCAPLVLWGC